VAVTLSFAILHRMEPSRRFGLSTCHGWPLIWSLLIPGANPRSVRSCPSDLCAGVLLAAPTGNNGRTDRASVLQPLTISDQLFTAALSDCACRVRGNLVLDLPENL
jgi:hypothetical protein